MRRKIGCILFAAALLVSLGRTAAAAEETGSIRVTLRTDEGEIALYHAGTPVPGGYRLEESFGGGLIKEEDIYSPILAEWLAESAEDGKYRILDADGSAEFSRLEEGLYLLVQTETEEGYYPIEPFLVALPYEGQWNIQANPKTEWIETETPHTGQNPMPFFGAAGMLLSGTGLILCTKRRRRK